jgi:ammonia channel protein AmtB
LTPLHTGGGPVEIGSGVGGLAYAWVLGRRQPSELVNFRPHNVSLVSLGTFMLWFGWLGFNGGSAFGANLRAIEACWNSNLCAAFGGIAWCLLDYRLEKKWSMVGLCSGTIAGLVAATPVSFSHSVLRFCRVLTGPLLRYRQADTSPLGPLSFLESSLAQLVIMLQKVGSCL